MDAVFFVTGSSRGIGRGLVEAILNHNKECLVVGISRSNSFEHERFIFVEADLSREAEKISEEIFRKYKPVRRAVLINNAGTLGHTAYFGKIDNNKVENAFQLNITAPAILMNEFIRAYSEEKLDTLILNISSGAGKYAVDGWAVYCASKAALDMLSHAAALEASKKGSSLKVFSVSPGVVDTEMQREIREARQEDFSRLPYFKQLKNEGGLQSAEKVAQKVMRLINNPREFDDVIQDIRDF